MRLQILDKSPFHFRLNMEIVSHFLAILSLLALVVTYGFKRTRRNSNKSKRSRAPEPSGAWPLVGHLHLLRGRDPLAKILGAMADKYGPIFSLRLASRPALVVSSWELAKECLTTNDRIFASRPSLAVGKYLGYENAAFGLSPYGPYWRDVRKMVTLELFTNHQLEKLKHVRAMEVDSSIKDLHKLWSENGELPTKINMGKWFELLTFNITINMLVGNRYSTGNAAEGLHYKKVISKALYLSGLVVVSDVIPSLEWMDIGGYVKEMKETGKELDRFIGEWLEEHRRKRTKCDGNGDGDFMDVMLSTLAKDTVLVGRDHDTVIKATTLMLILTGTESISETLIWALSLLLNHPHVLKNVQDELDVHIGRHRWAEESDIKNLPYLQAVVKETLRLYPPGPLAGPHEATEDCYVSGYYVPKGTRLLINLWKLHRDPRIWSEPYEFQPERFLDAHAKVDYRGQHFEFIPFSSGRRMCPAITYGSQVAHLILARLVHGFNLSTPMGMPVDMGEGLGIALPKVKPLEAILTPRLPLELY